ncbi:hypothetical protein [Calidithermus terrae]|nr:hypothetical protein [Calidithermus terrae]
MNRKALAKGLAAASMAGVLAACGGGGGASGGEIQGSVRAPAGGSAAGSRVIACFVEGNQCNAQSPNTRATVVGANGAYNLSLAAGQYVVLAIKDVDGSGSLTAGDYGGIYTEGGKVVAVSPPKAGVNIQMEVLTEDSGLRAQGLEGIPSR